MTQQQVLPGRPNHADGFTAKELNKICAHYHTAIIIIYCYLLQRSSTRFVQNITSNISLTICFLTVENKLHGLMLSPDTCEA